MISLLVILSVTKNLLASFLDKWVEMFHFVQHDKRNGKTRIWRREKATIKNDAEKVLLLSPFCFSDLYIMCLVKMRICYFFKICHFFHIYTYNRTEIHPKEAIYKAFNRYLNKLYLLCTPLSLSL